jgi:hypothetical protein
VVITIPSAEKTKVNKVKAEDLGLAPEAASWSGEASGHKVCAYFGFLSRHDLFSLIATTTHRAITTTRKA